jgi:hypothetical protein
MLFSRPVIRFAEGDSGSNIESGAASAPSAGSHARSITAALLGVGFLKHQKAGGDPGDLAGCAVMSDLAAAAVGWLGHQFQRPSTTATEGTSKVRIKKESTRTANAIVKPSWRD